MFVCCECVLSGRGLYDELIIRPEESYRLWCVVVCDLETLKMRPWPALGRSATGRKDALISQIYFGIKLYMFLTVPLSIIRSFWLYTQQWYTSYRFAESLRTGSGWNCSSILILFACCQQICMTYHCCMYSEKLLMMESGTVRDMESFIPN
jgi:hypothetical protein